MRKIVVFMGVALAALVASSSQAGAGDRLRHTSDDAVEAPAESTNDEGAGIATAQDTDERASIATSNKDCRDRCFKAYSRCRKKGRGCIADKQSCDNRCR